MYIRQTFAAAAAEGISPRLLQHSSLLQTILNTTPALTVSEGTGTGACTLAFDGSWDQALRVGLHHFTSMHIGCR